MFISSIIVEILFKHVFHLLLYTFFIIQQILLLKHVFPYVVNFLKNFKHAPQNIIVQAFSHFLLQKYLFRTCLYYHLLQKLIDETCFPSINRHRNSLFKHFSHLLLQFYFFHMLLHKFFGCSQIHTKDYEDFFSRFCILRKWRRELWVWWNQIMKIIKVVASLYWICPLEAQIDPHAVFTSLSSSQNEGKVELPRW